MSTRSPEAAKIVGLMVALVAIPGCLWRRDTYGLEQYQAGSALDVPDALEKMAAWYQQPGLEGLEEGACAGPDQTRYRWFRLRAGEVERRWAYRQAGGRLEYLLEVQGSGCPFLATSGAQFGKEPGCEPDAYVPARQRPSGVPDSAKSGSTAE